MSDVDAFAIIERLRELSEKEHDLEVRENVEARAKYSPQKLEQQGLLLQNMQIVNASTGLGGKVLVELARHVAFAGSHDQDQSGWQGWSSGDVVEVSAGQSSSRKATSSKKQGPKASKNEDTLEGVILRTSKTKIVVACDQDTDVPDLDRCSIYKLSDDATYRRQIATLERLDRLLKAGKVQENHLHAVLLGLSTPLTSAPVQSLRFLDEKLNESQRKAIEHSLDSELAVIHGPPGTGKTSTIIELIRQTLERKPQCQMLVAGSSNLAVDNILLRLVQHKVAVTRLGHPARVLPGMVEHTLDAQSFKTNAWDVLKDLKNEIDGNFDKLRLSGKHRIRGKERNELWQATRALRQDLSKRELKVTQEVLGSARVVLATCHGCGSKLLQGREFDLIIIDEAAAAVEPSCWIPILKGRRLVLVIIYSCHRRYAALSSQMVPSRRSFIACLQLRHLPDGKKGSTEPSLETAQSTPRIGPPASLSDTLFARIIRAFPDTRHLLNIQYRFNTDINDFPSMKMYETKLMPDKSVKDRNLGELLADNDPESDLHQPVIFFDTAGLAMSESGDEGESKWNENEATIVHDYVTNLVSNRSTVVSQIPQGYIPDHEQLSLGLPAAAIAVISPYRAQVGVLHHRLVNLGVEVGSVDSWQGREQEVVIISLVRSNDEGEVGFLRDSRRLNVAMTRAKRQLVIVGDSQTVKQGTKFLKAWMDWLEDHADVRVPEW